MLCATFSIICVVKKSVTRVFEAFPKWLQQGACGVSGVELRIRCAGSIRHVAPGKTMVDQQAKIFHQRRRKVARDILSIGNY